MKKFLVIIVAKLLFVMPLIKALAQDTSCPKCKPLPRMFVFPTKDVTRIDEFKKNRLFRKSKYDRLVKRNGKQDTNFYFTVNAVKLLLQQFDTDASSYDSVWVTFAGYNKSMSPGNFPSVNDSELIFLFSVVKDKYYFLLKDNFYVVPANFASNWITNYETGDLPDLSRSVKRNDATNRYNGKLSDTRNISYNKADFREGFIDEPEYQKCLYKKDVVGFKAYFSAYERKGRTAMEKDPGTNRKRLFLQFSYIVDQLGQLIPLDITTEDGFGCRQKSSKNKFAGGSVIDNGQLCPTYCPQQ